jgi:hypothetical protein
MTSRLREITMYFNVTRYLFKMIKLRDILDEIHEDFETIEPFQELPPNTNDDEETQTEPEEPTSYSDIYLRDFLF